MLSFEIGNAGNSIQVYCDADGLDVLIIALQNYKASSGEGHLQLCSPGAGGNQLSETTPWGKEAVPEVIITMD